MSTDMRPDCSLILTPETLSAWRDNTLEAREERRIGSHIPTCAACQAHLHQFEQIAAVLRSERVPLPPEPLWPGLRERLDAPVARKQAIENLSNQLRERLDGLDTPVAPSPHQQRRPAIAGIGGGLAVLAAVLIVAIVHFSVAPLPSTGAIQVRGAIQAGPTPTSGPAPTVAPAQPLTWKTLAEPAIFNQAGIIAFPVLAPGDANTVYACVWNYSDQAAATAIWATHDGGDSWSIVGHLPANPSGPCSLTVDATQSQALVATVMQFVQPTCHGGQCSPTPTTTPLGPANSPSFLSTDGGITWTSIGTKRSYMQLATYKGLTYALVGGPWPGDSSGTGHLAVSSDLRSWQKIDQPILQGGVSLSGAYFPDTVWDYWLNPTNGSLLAVTSPYRGYSAERLWESDDGGHTWKEITPTAFQPRAVAVQPPAAGRPWDICVTNWDIDSVTYQQMTGNNLLACTTDGGRTWVPRPALNVPTPSSGTNAVQPLVIITIGADGALIAAAQENDARVGYTFDLYRLPPSSSTWEPLVGPAPNPHYPNPNPDPNSTLGTFQAYALGAIVYTDGQFYITTYP